MNLTALFKVNYGVYIVSSKNGDKLNGQIGNTVFQVTAEPPQIAISINKDNLTHEFIEKEGVFSVSILSKETPLQFIGRFGFRTGRDFDKFEGVKYKLGVTGAPIVLENTVAYVECRVVKKLDVGTHTIFVGEVVDADIVSSDEPMTYSYYHEVKRGTTPKNAPVRVESK
ncbi:MAG: flavin reductase [Thermotoga sp.]|nr:MAG: flavin reductase [Thermotoga sp.]